MNNYKQKILLILEKGQESLNIGKGVQTGIRHLKHLELIIINRIKGKTKSWVFWIGDGNVRN